MADPFRLRSEIYHCPHCDSRVAMAGARSPICPTCYEPVADGDWRINLHQQDRQFLKSLRITPDL